MKYTVEIEEETRTLEFALEVECHYWNEPSRTTGAWEDCYEGDAGFDVISVDIRSVIVIDDDGKETFIRADFVLFDLIECEYQAKIELILDEDDKLFEAWKKDQEDY